jgi:hypothetical protein
MNVYTLTKDELYDLGLEITARFVQANGMGGPRFRRMRLVDKPRGSYGCGYYSELSKMVVVDADACAVPARGVMRSWSFPGYSVDRTPVGVLAHEVGHYIDHMWNFPSSLFDFSAPTIKREVVSSYEPNATERFAETMRLFITNPALLEHWRPERYRYLVRNTGLAQPKRMPRDPLATLRKYGATDAILAAAARKCGTSQHC